jgi:hypothetical protein
LCTNCASLNHLTVILDFNGTNCTWERTVCPGDGSCCYRFVATFSAGTFTLTRHDLADCGGGGTPAFMTFGPGSPGSNCKSWNFTLLFSSSGIASGCSNACSYGSFAGSIMTVVAL